MLGSPTKPQCPGTTSDETATTDKRNMPDCTVNNPLVNTPHVNSTCNPTPCVNTVNNHINTCPTAISNPSLLYDTLYPTLLHQHSTLVSLQHILNSILHLNTIPSHELQLLHRLLGCHPSALPHLPLLLRAAAHAGHPPSPTLTQPTLPHPTSACALLPPGNPRRCRSCDLHTLPQIMMPD